MLHATTDPRRSWLRARCPCSFTFWGIRSPCFSDQYLHSHYCRRVDMLLCEHVTMTPVSLCNSAVFFLLVFQGAFPSEPHHPELGQPAPHEQLVPEGLHQAGLCRGARPARLPRLPERRARGQPGARGRRRRLRLRPSQ